MQAARLTRDEAETIRAAFLDEVHVTASSSPYIPDSRHTLYLRILDELSHDIVQRALTQADIDARALAQALQSIESDMLTWFQTAGDEWGSYEVWRHKRDAVSVLEHWSTESIEQLDRALTSYYAQPARSLLLDRVLIDMLMARRVHAFAINLSQTPGWSRGKSARPSGSFGTLLLSIFARSLLTVLALALLLVGTKWAIEAGVVDAAWAAAIATLFTVAVAPLCSAVIIRNRLRNWADARLRHDAAQLYTAASDAYTVLADDNAAISTARLQTALDGATAHGVSWTGVDLTLNDLRQREVTALPALAILQQA